MGGVSDLGIQGGQEELSDESLPFGIYQIHRQMYLRTFALKYVEIVPSTLLKLLDNQSKPV